jgi:hypothetical protein
MCSLPAKAAGLIGMDFMEKTGATIDFEKGIAVISRGPELVSVLPTRQAAFSSFHGLKRDTAPSQPTGGTRERQEHSSNSKKTTSQTKSWLIKSIENRA